MGIHLALLFADLGHQVILGSWEHDRTARTIERMTLLSGELGQRYGYFPRMNYKLLGEPWSRGQADQGSARTLLNH